MLEQMIQLKAHILSGKEAHSLARNNDWRSARVLGVHSPRGFGGPDELCLCLRAVTTSITGSGGLDGSSGTGAQTVGSSDVIQAGDLTVGRSADSCNELYRSSSCDLAYHDLHIQ